MVCRVLGKDNIMWNAFASTYAKKTKYKRVVMVGEGLIHTRDDLTLMRILDQTIPITSTRQESSLQTRMIYVPSQVSALALSQPY